MAKPYLKDAGVINIGEMNEERSFIDYELCGHDEGKPCEKVERIEAP